ncbi:MAG: DNA helicase [Rhodospirillaceae bacterium]|nr:DNA helicase [Rhodospirillaceae bacterium]
MSFNNLGLGANILNAIKDAGYTEPTPIQSQAIPAVLNGTDVLGCAQTGTGKTASFTLPIIERLSKGRGRARMPRSLILTPTRELATQISENFVTYGKYEKLSMALLIGGVSAEEQQKRLTRGVDVLIATPGRLLDLFDRGSLLLNDVKFLVIDEADRMLDMGFIPDVEKIVGCLPKERQTMMFSATMPDEIRKLTKTFLTNPTEITVAPPATIASTVTESLIEVTPRSKNKALRELLKREGLLNALIFCNRKKDVDVLNRSLRRYGFLSAPLHGDMAQSARETTLQKFKTGDIKLLVATDVAGRGIDVESLTHVFNYDVPLHAEDYVHRIGRTGRAGKHGFAFMLVCPEDSRYVEAINKLIGHEIRSESKATQQKINKPQSTTRQGKANSVTGSSLTSQPKTVPRPKIGKATPSEPEPRNVRPSPSNLRDNSISETKWGGPVPAFLLKKTLIP